jgi:ADP-heptose:LPS heptosyltransferase
MFRFLKSLMGNEFDRLLKKASNERKQKFLIIWNRGLGDIALGLYALVHRIKSAIPDAHITFLTRKELEDGFRLLSGVDVVSVPWWKRGVPIDLGDSLKRLNISESEVDIILEKVNPTKWLSWQIGKLVPKLVWNEEYEKYCERFALPDGRHCIGVHLNSETGQFYNYQKDWPAENWKTLFEKLCKNSDAKIVLFGNGKTGDFDMPSIIDLRGETGLLELLAIIKNRCHTLIAPDGGILSLTYYIDAYYPIKVISLWGDSGQGVLKQRVPSPNKGLIHVPLCGANANISNISIDEVVSNISCSNR